MTDPAIQDGREAIRDVLLRLFVPTRGEIVSFNKTMALIDAWGAEREAAGAVRALEGQQCQYDAGGYDGCEGRDEGCMSGVCFGYRNAVSRLQTCQNTLREIMGVDGRSE